MRAVLLSGVVVASLSFTAWGNEELQICRCRDHHAANAQAYAATDSKAARKYAPDREVDVLHIRLDVTPDFQQKTISGTTRIEFTPIADDLTELRLNAVRLTIDAVRGSATIAEHLTDDESLTVMFEEPIPAGQKAYVEIDHSAEPSRGFYFRTHDMGYAKSDVHVWTQGEPHEARHWFPCIDYPNEKSTTEVICHVPTDMTVLSNGRMMSEVQDAETGLKAVRWLQEKPHANYLICLVAGYLAKLEKSHRDVPLRFFTQPSLAEHATNAFADTQRIMAFYEEEIGVPFPWAKYDQVTILDFHWGGMENTSLTTLTNRTVHAKQTENIRTSHGLDAHEMAHQWFGDYVTCKDWSHLWLNEGFATYYTHLYEGHKNGRDAMLYGLYRDATGRIFTNAKDTRPIVYRNYRSAGEQFDYRAYPKGSWVLHMLRSQLGADLYRDCIRTYLKRHALGTVETENLVTVLEELSGRSFDSFFDQWVYHARHPDLKIRYRWLAKEKLAEVSIEQTQPTSDDVLLFQFPAKLRFHLGDDYDQYVDHDVDINAKKHVFHVALPEQPAYVRFDPDLTVLADVSFRKTDAMLRKQLGNVNDVVGRLRAIDALQERKTKANVAALKERLQEDSFYAVRMQAAKALQAVDTDEAFTALLKSTDQPNARVRSQVVSSLAAKYRPEVRTHLQDVLREESNPAIIAEAIRGLAKFQQPAVSRQLMTLLRRTSFRNEISIAAVRALRNQDHTAAVTELMSLVDKRGAEYEAYDLSTILEAVGHLSRDKQNRSKVRDWLASHLAHPKRAVQIGAIRGLGSLRDQSATAILRSLASDDEGDRVGRAANAALKTLNEQSQFVPQEVRELRKLVQELQSELKDVQTELKLVQSKQEANGAKTPSDETPNAKPAREVAQVTDE